MYTIFSLSMHLIVAITFDAMGLYLLGIHLVVGLLNCMEVPFLAFKDTFLLFPTVLVLICTPTDSYRSSAFSTSSSHFVSFCVFNNGLCVWGEVISHCSFNLHLQKSSDSEHFFVSLLAFVYFFILRIFCFQF